jgi:hypothetical protein
MPRFAARSYIYARCIGGSSSRSMDWVVDNRTFAERRIAAVPVRAWPAGTRIYKRHPALTDSYRSSPHGPGLRSIPMNSALVFAPPTGARPKAAADNTREWPRKTLAEQPVGGKRRLSNDIRN